MIEVSWRKRRRISSYAVKCDQRYQMSFVDLKVSCIQYCLCPFQIKYNLLNESKMCLLKQKTLLNPDWNCLTSIWRPVTFCTLSVYMWHKSPTIKYSANIYSSASNNLLYEWSCRKKTKMYSIELTIFPNRLYHVINIELCLNIKYISLTVTNTVPLFTVH
jgi:hypothetical protein